MITIIKKKLSRVNENNDLGVTFDSKLNSEYHTNHVIKKQSARFKFYETNM